MRVVDDVILDPPAEITEDFLKSFNINLVAKSNKNEYPEDCKHENEL